MADWFYGKDGTQHGPVSEHELSSLSATGQIDGQTIIWRDGMADWLPMSQVPEFQSNTSNEGANPYHSPQAYPGQAPAAQAYAPAAPTDGLSIAALICGILAIISCYIWGLFGLPAVICGHLSLKKIKNSPTPIAGKGMAIAGLICGYIGIVFQLLMIIGGIFLFMESKQQMNDMETELQKSQMIEEASQPQAIEE